MDKAKKQFILKKLIPFILREQGRGFAMSVWRPRDISPGEPITYDNVCRKVPECGTVACIGGSLEALGACKDADNRGGRALGISHDAARGLFYNWYPCTNHFAWPLSFANRYKKAKTTLGKAKVAVALLREVVKTNGKCLERRDGER